MRVDSLRSSASIFLSSVVRVATSSFQMSWSSCLSSGFITTLLALCRAHEAKAMPGELRETSCAVRTVRPVVGQRVRPSDSPRSRLVVFQEQAPNVLAGVHAVEDRIEDARRAVDDVERGVEAVDALFALGVVRRILVGDPA